jgi:hypothetical protein
MRPGTVARLATALINELETAIRAGDQGRALALVAELRDTRKQASSAGD